MYSWSVASMKKSILFDVLNVIDSVSQQEASEYWLNENSLLKNTTFTKYTLVFETARIYDDAIAAAIYVPEKQSSNDQQHTALYNGFMFETGSRFSSFDDLLNFIKNLDRENASEYIMKHCLCMEQKIIPEDFIPIIIRSKDMLSISQLNDTKLPKKIKFSLTTLIFNYKEFLEKLISYLNSVHEVVKKIYEEYKEIYKYTSRLTRDYLVSNDIEKFLLPEVQNEVSHSDQPKKYTVVLSMLRLEYSFFVNVRGKAIVITGLFFIQRILHDINFKIF